MSALHVSLFGKFRVWYGDDETGVIHIEASKAQQLLSYLLLNRYRAYPRESLAELLWKKGSDAQTKKGLRQTLWQLQTILDTCTENTADRLLFVDSEWIGLNQQVDFWLDVDIFEQAASIFQDKSGAELNEQSVAQLEAALQLYRGALLEGWYEDWCLYERERLQNVAVLMLSKLIDYCETHHHYEAGIAYGERLLRLDRAHERTHQSLMRLHYLAGDRTLALRQYQRCLTALREELAVKPAHKTDELYKRMCADQVAVFANIASASR